MLWAAATLCFFGFLRSGEITVPSDAAFDPSCHLTFQDATVNQVTDQQLLRVHLKTSPEDRPLPYGRRCLCWENQASPVAAMLAYLAIRTPKPGFLFQFTNGRLLTKPRPDIVSNPDRSLCSAGCIASPPRAGDAIHPALRRERSGFETSPDKFSSLLISTEQTLLIASTKIY